MDINQWLEQTSFLGVCSWLSKKLNTDVKGVRIFFIIITLLGIGSPILLYLLLWVVKEYIV